MGKRTNPRGVSRKSRTSIYNPLTGSIERRTYGIQGRTEQRQADEVQIREALSGELSLLLTVSSLLPSYHYISKLILLCVGLVKKTREGVANMTNASEVTGMEDAQDNYESQSVDGQDQDMGDGVPEGWVDEDDRVFVHDLRDWESR